MSKLIYLTIVYQYDGVFLTFLTIFLSGSAYDVINFACFLIICWESWSRQPVSEGSLLSYVVKIII